MTIPVSTWGQQRSLWQNLRQLASYRELLISWMGREIRSRYRQSVLGFGWALIQPLFQMIVITVIFGTFLQVPSEGIPYAVFTYAAILPWSLFANSISAAVPSILNNMQLVTKIYFPREILPLSAILARLVDFAIALLVFAGLVAWYRIPVYQTWLFVPLLLIIQITLALAISLLGAAISVFLRDVSFAIPLAMQLWMYATPVIYPLNLVPERWRSLYLLNPMAGIIDSYRRVLLQGQPPDLGYLGVAAAVSFLLCAVSYAYFKRLETAMADII
jgi:lipopolysaccharide transport system permease protein